MEYRSDIEWNKQHSIKNKVSKWEHTAAMFLCHTQNGIKSQVPVIIWKCIL